MTEQIRVSDDDSEEGAVDMTAPLPVLRPPLRLADLPATTRLTVLVVPAVAR